MRSFADRITVVTGAANGIGRALSLRLAEKGCHLALVARFQKRIPFLQPVPWPARFVYRRGAN